MRTHAAPPTQCVRLAGARRGHVHPGASCTRSCSCGSCGGRGSCADHCARICLINLPLACPAPPVNPAGEDKEVIAARKLAFPWGRWLKEGGAGDDEGGSSEASAQTEGGGAKARDSSPLSDDLDRDADKDQVGGAGWEWGACGSPLTELLCVVWLRVLGFPRLRSRAHTAASQEQVASGLTAAVCCTPRLSAG